MNDHETSRADSIASNRDTMALECWQAIQDEIVRGVAHAMSNRVATISAGLYMLGETGHASSTSISALHGEVDLLEQLLQQLRQLPRDTATVEPLLASDSARAALALHDHHGEFRNVPCDIDDPGTVPPARAVPQALLHALLVALTAARSAAANGERAVLQLRGEDDVVRFIATVAGRDDIVDTTRDRFRTEADAITRLLRDSGGRGVTHANGCVVEVPTLAASRRPRG